MKKEDLESQNNSKPNSTQQQQYHQLILQQQPQSPVKDGRLGGDGDVCGGREYPTTKRIIQMGGAEDRTYYGATPRCPPNTGGVGGPPPTREFHYSVPDHFRTGSASSRQSRNSSSASSNYHSPHVASSSSSSRRSGSGRSAAGAGGAGAPEQYYLDKSSPYHHGRRQQDYFMRQQDYEHRMAHHSGSRSDLLDHDHTAALYEHGLAYTNNQPYTFVRMCDGKFVRTTIPIHDFEALDSALTSNPASAAAGAPYYRTSVNHTLRRPSKRHVVAQDYACCPRDELQSQSQAASAGRQQAQSQSYATLRGRKWVEKQRAACASGVGDNFGRSVYLEDSRSINSFNDDLALSLPPGGREFHGGGNVPTAMLMTSASIRTNLSRSTDRNLDNLGLSDEDLLLESNRTSAEEMLTLLTREPPDGKEKPEPSKSTLLKMEHNTLSRKSSKCDLLASNAGSGNNSSVIQQQQQQPQNDSRSEAASVCGDNSSVLSGQSKTEVNKRDSVTKDNPTVYVEVPSQPQQSSEADLDSTSGTKDWKGVPNSPRCVTTAGNIGPQSLGPLSTSMTSASTNGPSPKGSTGGGLPPPTSMVTVRPPPRGDNVANLNTGSVPRPLVQYNEQPSYVMGGVATAAQQQVAKAQQPQPPQPQTQPQIQQGPLTTVPPPNSQVTAVATPTPVYESIRKYLADSTSKFFGVNGEENNEKVWTERRRRVAIKLFGGVKDDFQIDGTTYEDSIFNDGNCGVRLRYDPLSSELVEGKMVLKIVKPPRNKDSLSSLTAQSFSWVFNSLTTRKVPKHQCVLEHEASRSYQPSNTGIAAYYQADGLALRLPRVPSTHHLHGESPAEEVFFTKPSGPGCDDDPVGHAGRIGPLGPGGVPRGISGYNPDPYSRSCSWQLPRPEPDLPRMGSDVGATRIWNRLLDAAFDNSDRRKHGMGYLGRMLTRRRRAKRRAPESSRKRKLGGNSADHRPFFTYWMTIVQIFIMLISMSTYGIGPIGIDLYKKSGMVLVTNLDVETVTHYEPANFWIGPSAIDLIHLGAKYAPCMRWDSVLDREIKEQRLKERDTACCIRKDRSGCVQSPKSECSKINDPNGVDGQTPRSKWWRPAEWYSQYPTEHRRSSGPVCGLDPQFCESPASVAPYVWPDDITKWPICRRKMDVETLEASGHGHAAEHMVCEVIGHPCCIGIRGQCKITTPEYCMFVGGSFHEEAALCSQVSCLDDVCGLLPFRDRDVPDQFYRVWTPLFLHAGVLHLALTVALQYWLMRDLEKLCGSTRLSLIYLGSGMVGNLASAIFVPYRAEVGPAGAHFGLLALSMVEVIHQWPSLKYPEMAILKIVGITAVLFLAGLLPWVDNYAHLFGFIFGFLLSYALQPYVTFGLFDKKRKVILIWICFASVIFLFIGLLLLFYVTPIHDCEVCKYFNCIPITKDFCADQNINLEAEV